MIKRLRLKFVCINMAIVMTMLCVIFATVYQITKQNLETESILMMQNIASDPNPFGGPMDWANQIRLPYFTLQIGSHGEVIAIGGDDFDLSDEEFLREIIDAAITSQEQYGVLEQYDLRFCRTISPVGLSLIYADISSERSTLESLIQICLLIGVGSIVVFLGISILFAKWAVKPVEQAWDQQRQFVADASHELKTPLTVILTNAELLQEEEQDEDAKRRFMESILTMSHQMRGLVERLLELARVDNGVVRTTMTQVELSVLVEDAMLPFEALFFEQNLALEADIRPGITLKGSEVHLRQLVEIFLDNALKYAEGEGSVQVFLRRQGNSCLLTVSNPGPPISKEDLQNIFKRFYRVDKARAMNHSYGLGLSIAESITKEHRGKIWAESDQGVNTFCVQLPL